jgi:anti-sigma factor RsiW
MNHDHTNPDRPPAPERFAAYADGELGPAEGAEVEAWLTAHPEARAEVEVWRRLDRLWDAASPPEPDSAAWARTLGRIESAIPPARSQRPRRPWPALLALGLSAAAAAALLGVSFLQRPGQPVVPGASPSQAVESSPFPVVAAEDVVIISMEGADLPALVIGRPPVQFPMDLATPDDVRLVQAGEPDSPEGWVPDIWFGDGTAPMVVPMPPQKPKEE